MKMPRVSSVILVFGLTLLVACHTPCARAAEPTPVPAGLALSADEAGKIASGKGGVSRDRIAACVLGLPYRVDGAVNEAGEYTLFASPEKRFSTPGLNCSGLVLQLSRMLLGKNVTLAQAARDRVGDSGPKAALGHDWDFGWDLILNVSDGTSRRFLLPGGKSLPPEQADARRDRGFDCQSGATWQELSRRFTPGHIYLVSLNVEGRRKGYGLTHYHVGIVYVAGSGEAWFYQTTGKGGGANRRDLKSAAGQASFKRAFANNGKYRRMMAVLEVDLP